MDRSAHPPAAAPLSVGVIGAGVAGLTAAWLLSGKGWRVTIYEAAPVVGGRLRSLATTPPLDIGSHLLVNAYHSTRQLLNDLSISCEFHTPRPVTIQYRWQNRTAQLRFGNLPASIRYLAAFLRSDLLPVRERWALLRQLVKLKVAGKRDTISTSAADEFKTGLLNSGRELKQFWQLMSVSLFNTQLIDIDPVLLATTLQKLFFQDQGVDPMLAESTVSAGIITPLIEKAVQRNCVLKLRAPVDELRWREGGIEAVVTPAGIEQHNRYILALPLHRWCRLQGCDTPVSGNTIATIYLNADELLTTASITGFPDAPIHWLMRQRIPESDDLIYAAVISDYRGSREELENIWQAFQADYFPGSRITVLKTVIYHQAVPKQDSAFLKWRSLQELSGGNWDTIGDWTHPELPATVEAAIDSAVRLVKNRFQVNESE